MTSPDRQVKERALQTMLDKGPTMYTLLETFGSASLMPEDRLIDQYLDRQLDVAEDKMAPEQFIDYCRQHGIAMRYTPFAHSKKKD